MHHVKTCDFTSMEGLEFGNVKRKLDHVKTSDSALMEDLEIGD